MYETVLLAIFCRSKHVTLKKRKTKFAESKQQNWDPLAWRTQYFWIRGGKTRCIHDIFDILFLFALLNTYWNTTKTVLEFLTGRTFDGQPWFHKKNQFAKNNLASILKLQKILGVVCMLIDKSLALNSKDEVHFMNERRTVNLKTMKYAF